MQGAQLGRHAAPCSVTSRTAAVLPVVALTPGRRCVVVSSGWFAGSASDDRAPDPTSWRRAMDAACSHSASSSSCPPAVASPPAVSLARVTDTWDGTLDYAASSALPSPCNTPTTEDSVDDSESVAGDAELFASLRQNPYYSHSERPGLDLLSMGHGDLVALSQIYVILFGLDANNEEGIYSLRALGPDGMPQDTIVVFESERDAERYSCLLEVTMEPHTPHVYSISALELVDFCHERNYQCRLEHGGSLLIPPDYNVRLTDWERASKLRSGSYAVLALDPDASAAAEPASSISSSGTLDVAPSRASSSSGGGSGGSSSSSSGNGATQTVHPQSLPGGKYAPAGAPGGAGAGVPSSALAKYQSLGRDELDAIREQLEALLPPDEAD